MHVIKLTSPGSSLRRIDAFHLSHSQVVAECNKSLADDEKMVYWYFETSNRNGYNGGCNMCIGPMSYVRCCCTPPCAAADSLAAEDDGSPGQDPRGTKKTARVDELSYESEGLPPNGDGSIGWDPQSYTAAAKVAEGDDFALHFLLQVSSCGFETFYHCPSTVFL